MFNSDKSNNRSLVFRVVLAENAEKKYNWSNLISDGLIVINNHKEIVFINNNYRNWLNFDIVPKSLEIPPLSIEDHFTEFVFDGALKTLEVKSINQDDELLVFVKDYTDSHVQTTQIEQYERLFGRVIHSLPFGLLHLKFFSKKHIELLNANNQFYVETNINPDADIFDMVVVLRRLNVEIISFLEQALLYKDYKPVKSFKIPDNQTIKITCIPTGTSQVIVLFENITTQLEADAYRKKNERRLMLAQRATSDGLADFDFEHDELYLSPRFYSMLGYQENVFDASVENWYRLVHPDDQNEIIHITRDEVIKGKDFFRIEFRMRTNSDQWCWILVRGQVVKRDNKQNPLRVVGTHQDITMQKEQTQKIKNQEDKLKRFINNIDGLVYRCKYDEQWPMEFVSEGVQKLTGYTVDDIICSKNISYSDIIDVRDRQMVWDLITDFKGTTKVFDLVYRIKTKENELKWVHERGSFIHRDDQVPFIEGVVLDITAQKEAEIAKTTSDKKFQTYIANAPDGMLVVNKQQMIVEFNKTALQMMEYHDEQLVNQPFKLLTHGHQEDMRIFFRLLHEVGQATAEMRMRSRTNKIFYAMISGVRLPDRLYLLFVKDINVRKNTELQLKQKNREFQDLNNSYSAQNKVLVGVNEEFKVMNNELRLAKNKAEESEHLKSAFLANMSHEIRTPMNGILGFSRLLINSQLSKEKRERYMSVIEKSGDQLLALINNILDISKIETDQVKINFELLNLHDFFHDVFARFSNDVGRGGIELLLDLPKQSVAINTDQLRMNQVFTNFITNALKFTNKGHIRIGYTVEKSKVICFVEDTGQGIPPSQHERIFERFQQVDTSYDHTRGTGLGLAIAKGLVTLLGGTISVKSSQGEGSTFMVKFPL